MDEGAGFAVGTTREVGAVALAVGEPEAAALAVGEPEVAALAVGALVA